MNKDNQFDIGKHVMETLTTGMYNNPMVMYREYIQNACDQIDEAICSEMDTPNNFQVHIITDTENRRIEIFDNATGIPVMDFKRRLGNIAASEKKQGEAKGFRGIGRLCGLAYCDTLVFSSRAPGEAVVSFMEIDAKEMRKMLSDGENYELSDLWQAIVSFRTENVKPADEPHFFKVELRNICPECGELLEQEKVNNYLQAVAPLPYSATFCFKEKIKDHVAELRNTGKLPKTWKIDEYNIFVNDSKLTKGYKEGIYDQTGKRIDEIKDIEFKDFYAEDGRLIAWLWYGVSSFIQQIKDCNPMRGLRMRKENIQIGDENSFVKLRLFKEQRGNFYYMGEVFAVDKRLVPNSQRDDFEDGSACSEFRQQLRVYFYDILGPLYRDANQLKNLYRSEEQARKEEEKLQKPFTNKEERKNQEEIARRAREKAEEDKKKAGKLLQDTKKPEVFQKVRQNVFQKAEAKGLTEPARDVKAARNGAKLSAKTIYLTDELSALPKEERKLVSRIYAILKREIPSAEEAERIIFAIQSELKSRKS